MSKKQCLWVLEMYVGNGWVSTCWVGLTKRDAAAEMKRFKEDNRGDRCRIAKYVREEK